jgi:hypothetical protein
VLLGIRGYASDRFWFDGGSPDRYWIRIRQRVYGVTQAVPGLGDAAEFGTASCSVGTCGTVLVVQVRGGTVAHVTVAAGSPSEAPVLSLARAVLAAISN